MLRKSWKRKELPLIVALTAFLLLSGCGQTLGDWKAHRDASEEVQVSDEESEESDRDWEEEDAEPEEQEEKEVEQAESEGEDAEQAEPEGEDAELEEQEGKEAEQEEPAGEWPVEGQEEGSESDVGFPEKEAWVSRQIQSMSLEEKVAQMFFISPETLINGNTTVTAAGELTRTTLEEYPVGGLVYSTVNLQNPNQTKKMLANTQAYACAKRGIPIFLGVDEEGGRVARIGRNSGFSVEKVPAMAVIGATGDIQKAYEAGDTIGSYLSELGFNVDWAPDADVLTNPSNTVIGDRSFGSDPELVASMTMQMAEGLSAHGIIPCVKHFPGHGGTDGDTHKGLAYTDKTLAELQASELIPFQKAVDEKILMIMASHISVPSITGSDVPVSLSHTMITELLRDQMGYQGIVITDAMGMGAIADNYRTGEAAVMAVEAGCDMLLMGSEFRTAYKAVLDAVAKGRLTEDRIGESVRRILNVKYSLPVDDIFTENED